MKIVKTILANLFEVFLFFLPPLIVFVVHIILCELFDIYWKIPRFDIPMHFIGGVSFAFSLIALFRFLQKQEAIPQMDLFISVFFIFTTIATVAIVWEFAELASDLLFKTQTQVSVKDTMLDIFLGMAGGLSMALIYKPNTKNDK